MRRPTPPARLALLPPGGCQDAVEEDGELSAMLVEALHEVVNVLSALFNTPGAPHSKLHKLYAPGDEVAGDLAGMLAGFNRIDLAIEVQGYGKGATLPRPAVTILAVLRIRTAGPHAVPGGGAGAHVPAAPGTAL